MAEFRPSWPWLSILGKLPGSLLDQKRTLLKLFFCIIYVKGNFGFRLLILTCMASIHYLDIERLIWLHYVGDLQIWCN